MTITEVIPTPSSVEAVRTHTPRMRVAVRSTRTTTRTAGRATEAKRTILKDRICPAPEPTSHHYIVRRFVCKLTQFQIVLIMNSLIDLKNFGTIFKNLMFLSYPILLLYSMLTWVQTNQFSNPYHNEPYTFPFNCMSAFFKHAIDPHIIQFSFCVHYYSACFQRAE